MHPWSVESNRPHPRHRLHVAASGRLSLYPEPIRSQNDILLIYQNVSQVGSCPVIFLPLNMSMTIILEMPNKLVLNAIITPSPLQWIGTQESFIQGGPNINPYPFIIIPFLTGKVTLPNTFHTFLPFNWVCSRYFERPFLILK